MFDFGICWFGLLLFLWFVVVLRLVSSVLCLLSMIGVYKCWFILLLAGVLFACVALMPFVFVLMIMVLVIWLLVTRLFV